MQKRKRGDRRNRSRGVPVSDPHPSRLKAIKDALALGDLSKARSHVQLCVPQMGAFKSSAPDVHTGLLAEFSNVHKAAVVEAKKAKEAGRLEEVKEKYGRPAAATTSPSKEHGSGKEETKGERAEKISTAREW